MKMKAAIAAICFPVFSFCQNVGIGTATPVTKLNVVGNKSNPAIPGTASAALFRIGVSANEGIDFGKMGSAPFSAWMQAGFNGSADHLSLQPLGGNVGIGTASPTEKLDVNGNSLFTGIMNVNGNMRLQGLNLFEFGAGVAGKEVNAGKIGYNAFGQSALTIVGAGTNATNRAVYFFAEGGTTFGGPANIFGNVYIDNNLQVNQKVTATVTGSANLIPVCYGTIDGTTLPPTILSGSGNFSVARHFAGSYGIFITGKFLTDVNYTAVVTCQHTGFTGGAFFWHFPGVSPAQVPGGGLEIQSNNSSDQKFSFVVYMPN